MYKRQIWAYTVEIWDKDQAERYLRMLNIGFVDLTLNPTLGRSCDTVREGYRKFRVGRHVIFYRVIEQRIDVVRVLHQ